MVRRIVTLVAVSLLAVACKPSGGGEMPAQIVGSWYSGQGYTTLPYDSQTGEFGMPDGQGLVFIFHDDGTYERAYQSYQSGDTGCTTGMTAYDRGTVSGGAGQFTITPEEGNTKFVDTCVSENNTEQPQDDLGPETFTYELYPDPYGQVPQVLQIADSGGNSSVFRPIQ
jgi:hypothetical protein